MKFIRFMSTPAGRGIRVVAGAALIAFGISHGGPVGWGVAAFGMLPLATGAANICPICPLVGGSARDGAHCGTGACS